MTGLEPFVIPIGAAIAGGATVAASRSASGSSKNAAQIQARSDAEALKMAKDNEARRRQEYDQANALEKQERAEYVARAQPYWDMSDAIGRRAGNRLGLNVGSMGGMRPPPGASPGGAPGTRTASADPRTIANMSGYTGYDGLNPNFPGAPSMVSPPTGMTIGDVLNWGSKRRGGNA